MDVASGDFKFDYATGAVVSKAGTGQRQYLDPEIAGEGTKVIMSDGTTVSYNPPPVNAAIFDYSKIKSLRHYFNRTDFHFFPMWVYHADGREEIARNAQEAGDQYGIFLVRRSNEERAKYGGGEYRWEFDSDSKWRTVRYSPPKFDPENPGPGKTVIHRAPDPKIAQHELIAQVIAAMQGGQNDFLERLLTAMGAMPAKAPAPVLGGGSASDEAKENDRELWRNAAEEVGIKVDRRWSTERLKQEIAAKTGDQSFVAEPAATMDVEKPAA